MQGEDVAARGRVLLFAVDKNSESGQAKVPSLYFHLFEHTTIY